MSFAWHEIRDHLIQSSSTLGFQRSFDTSRRTGNPIAQFRDPAAVLDALHRSHDGPDQKNLILATLVRVAQSGGPGADCALTLILLALWPGLDAIRRRSVWRKIGTPDEVASDILARTTEAIRGLDQQRVNWIAATILRNVERDMLRARQREVGRQSVISDTDPDEVAGDHDAQEPALSHTRLHGDMRRLIGTDATLVIRVAVEGFSQAEVAIELGLSEAAARKRYQRATRKLRDVLQEDVRPNVPIRMARWLFPFRRRRASHSNRKPTRMVSTADLSPDDLRRLPGLYRRWELTEVFETHRNYQIEDAGAHADGTPLLAIYVSDPIPDASPAPPNNSAPQQTEQRKES